MSQGKVLIFNGTRKQWMADKVGCQRLEKSHTNTGIDLQEQGLRVSDVSHKQRQKVLFGDREAD